ncbi:arylesterase [Thiomicrospira cyclica]|uniref:Lysophospholipase n=1 Tax=Thiomicrospira cyclica (strain DSM 14477 / JCM 11371 / ALM1) TaxID=717773 RepID=F6D8I2_THICA|nr:Lysophospholipase [Thiomicrospira cyclica ALM1]
MIVLGVMAFALVVASQTSQASTTLLVLGDSLSAAYGIPQQDGWVFLLDQKLSQQTMQQLKNLRVVNASLSGETTSGGLQRLPGLLSQHQPSYVIIELGANDALRGQNLAQTQQNLAQMIEVSLQQGAKVKLLGIRLPPNYGPAFDRRLAQMYQQLSEQYTVPLDPFFLADVALNPALMLDDGLHPNAAAQPLILERLWPQLQAWLTE